MSNEYNPFIFENPELWTNYDQSGEIKKKLPLIFNHIPADVASIIDVGCGNGEITNQFPEKYLVIGVDNSKEALKYIKKGKIHCSADNIPVEDLSYDMAFSSELLEHLPEKIVIKTISEFRRIAKKYIFISVPYKEQLEYYQIKCSSCIKKFHAYGHLNSFTAQSLHKLIGNDFRIVWTANEGKIVKEYNPLLLKLRHGLAKVYFAPSEYTVCPYCQNKSFPKHKGNIFSKLINGLNMIIPKKRKKYWLFVLFERI